MVSACLIGTGGVGSVAALALEQGKCAVTVVSRGIYQQVSEHGFEFESVDYGNIKNWKPTHIVNSVEAAAEKGPFDYVVVSTKNIPEIQKTEDVIRPLVQKGTSIVLIQNGIGAEETLMEAFPDAYVIGGVSMIGSANYNGKVLHTGHDELILGTYDKRPEAQAAIETFHKVYDATKSTAIIVENLKYRRWCKLVYNATYNTTAALTGLDTGRLAVADLRYKLVLPAMKEVRAIAEKELGEKLPEGIEDYMLHSDEDTFFSPSMLQDVRKGNPIELEVILGNPLRIAQKIGVDAPVLTTIYKLLHGKQFTLLEARGQAHIPADGSQNVTLPMHL